MACVPRKRESTKKMFCAFLFLTVLLLTLTVFPATVTNGLSKPKISAGPEAGDPIVTREASPVYSASEQYLLFSPPVINDFYINNTWAGQSSTFSFNVSSPSGDLASATLSTNVSSSFTNDTLSVSGSVAWADFTKTLPASSGTVAFDFWVFDANASLYATTGLRLLKVYAYNSTSGAWNTPFVNLGSAIQAVESANTVATGNCTVVDPYYTTVLNQQNGSALTYLANLIDSHDNIVTQNGIYSYCNDSVAKGWSNPSYAYDNLTGTYANYSIPTKSWSPYLVLNFSGNLLGSIIQYTVKVQSGSYENEMRIDIANATGSWTNVLDTTPSDVGGSYNTTFSSSQYSAMRFSFNNTYSGALPAYVIEAQGMNRTQQNDFVDIIKWSAICDKLGITRKQTIKDALGNYTMVGSLPYTGIDEWGTSTFSPESKWALYGYWYANSSWASANMTKWNVTAAYQQFNSSVYGYSYPVLWIYPNGSAISFNRYYDEWGCTIECYLIFYKLLNVTGALNDALYWWNWTNTVLWSGTHYDYASGDTGYECEAPFFLKIISILKYYDVSLPNWTNVLTDIDNRFLSSEWNSCQWLNGYTNLTTYVAIHKYANPGNNQTRLGNTLGAWQAMEGIYLQLNSTYEQDMVDMLYGNQATEPAWALLLRPDAGLFNSTSDLFRGTSNGPINANDTAQGEILMFMLGIVPQTTTVAFPLEELGYEYTYDINPTTLNINASSRTLTIPVNSAGTLTFQYGVSPITQLFNSSGVYRVVFSDSWNNIANVTLVSSLPSNAIYFSQLNAPTATEPTNGGGGRPAYVC